MIRYKIRRRAQALLIALTLAGAALAVEAAAAEQQVNINTADVDTLTLLPRVGSVVARRIVDFREANGKFRAIEDLMLVQGVGERTFELMEPYLTLEGETTLEEKVRVSSADDDG